MISSMLFGLIGAILIVGVPLGVSLLVIGIVVKELKR